MKLDHTLTAMLALASAASALPVEAKANYDGYRVFRVPAGDDVARINRFASHPQIDTWRAPSAGGFADLAVHPLQIDAFFAALGDLMPTIMHEDLGAAMARESVSYATRRHPHVQVADSADDSWFNSFHPWSDHRNFLTGLQKRYPANTKIVSSGKSAHGRDIPGIHLFGKDGAGSRPAIVLHGTVHGREWITTMAVEYVAHALLAGYGSDANLTRNLDAFDLYLFPVVNVDGFVYSQEMDRMWRKSRQNRPRSSCVGTDINRNWDYKWDGPAGASPKPCASTFKGKKAGDTPEVQALAGFLHKIQAAQGIKMYIDVHSYSQLFMFPYGHSCTAIHEKTDEYRSLANGTAAAIAGVHGMSFGAGPICNTIYITSGGSVDYVADVVKADYAFAIELRDRGEYGFVLPPAQILPSSEEAFAGLTYLMDHIK